MKRPVPGGRRSTALNQSQTHEHRGASKRVSSTNIKFPPRNQIVTRQDKLLDGTRGQLRSIAAVVRNRAQPEKLSVQNRDVMALRLRLSLVEDSNPISLFLDTSECFPNLDQADIKLNMIILATALKPMGNFFFWSTPGTIVLYADQRGSVKGPVKDQWIEPALREWFSMPQNYPRDIRGMEPLGVPEISELEPLAACCSRGKASLEPCALVLLSEPRFYGPHHTDIVVRDFVALCNGKLSDNNVSISRCSLHFYDNNAPLVRNLKPGQVVLVRAQYSMKDGFLNLTVKSPIEVLSTERCKLVNEKFDGNWVPQTGEVGMRGTEESEDILSQTGNPPSTDPETASPSIMQNYIDSSQHSSQIINEIQQIRADIETAMKFSEELMRERLGKVVESGRKALERIAARLEAVEQSLSSSPENSKQGRTESGVYANVERRLDLLEDRLDAYQSRTERTLLDMKRSIEVIGSATRKRRHHSMEEDNI